MRKVILSIMVSLDGFIEGPNKDLKWHVWDEEMEKHMYGFLNNDVDTILLGRVAYQLLADYWPSATESIAPRMNDLPKLVFSKTLENVEWKNSKLIRENIAEEILKMKQKPGKDLVIFGGASIAYSFRQLGIIDEYQIIVNPVVIGTGTPLFKGANDTHDLKLLKTKPFNCGNVILYYEPKPEPKIKDRNSKV